MASTSADVFLFSLTLTENDPIESKEFGLSYLRVSLSAGANCTHVLKYYLGFAVLGMKWVVHAPSV